LTEVSGVKLKVRPFVRTFELPPKTIVHATGAIDRDHFVVSFDLSEYRIPIVGVGEDDLGEFVEIEEQKARSTEGSILCVSAEFDEDEPGEAGCQIAVSSSNPVRAEVQKAVDEQLVRRGTWPTDVNVLYTATGPARSVHFNSSGQVDGCGGSTSGGTDKERGH
jgi:hypothetical protein